MCKCDGQESKREFWFGDLLVIFSFYQLSIFHRDFTKKIPSASNNSPCTADSGIHNGLRGKTIILINCAAL